MESISRPGDRQYHELPIAGDAMISPVIHTRNRSAKHCDRSGYTLVEILVVLFVLMLLAAIALPTVKELLSNQKVSRAAQNMTAFIAKARSRAIAEEKPFGVLIERGVGVDDTGNVIGLSQSIRLRQIAGVPPYTGDASNAYATLRDDPQFPNVEIAEFTVKDNQLLSLSRNIYSDANLTPQQQHESAPIRNGDYLELPGGRMVPITFMPYTTAAGEVLPDGSIAQSGGATARATLEGSDGELTVRVWFSLTKFYPEGSRTLSGSRVKYRIHRRPVVSSVTPFSMPRGVVTDLNYSGVGVAGNQFASLSDDKDIEIIFGADGSVLRVTNGWFWVSGTGVADWDETQVAPLGAIYLCIGDADGLVPNNLFSQDKKAFSNLLNLESIWVSINPYTGRCNASSVAPVDLGIVLANAGLNANSVLQTPNPDPSTGEATALADAIARSRYFATLSDSVDPE
jgi:type II secretory pathway pseudopilin PulG